MKIIQVSAAVLLAGFFCGCAHKPYDPALGHQSSDDKSQFVYLPATTGSHIPRRVRISDLASGATRPGAPITHVTGEGIRNVVSNPIRGAGGSTRGAP